MKSYLILVGVTTFALSLNGMHLPKAQGQNRNQSCPTGNQECINQRYQQDSQYNPNIHWRTPLQIRENELNTTTEVCQNSSNSRCEQVMPEIESRQNSETLMQLRETTRQRLNQPFSP